MQKRRTIAATHRWHGTHQRLTDTKLPVVPRYDESHKQLVGTAYGDPHRVGLRADRMAHVVPHRFIDLPRRRA